MKAPLSNHKPLRINKPLRIKRQGVNALLASGAATLLFTTAATAATFKVNYSGSVTGQSNFELAPFEDVTSAEIEERRALRPPEENTKIEGTYTFDDLTDEIISAQFQLITPTRTTTQAFIPTETVSDPDEIQALKDSGDFIGTFSTASTTAARYSTEIVTRSRIEDESVSVNNQSFSYITSFSGIGDGNGLSTTIGVIDRFAIEGSKQSEEPTPGETPPEEIATVPEPQSLLGLLLLAGVCLLRGRKRQQTSSHHA